MRAHETRQPAVPSPLVVTSMPMEEVNRQASLSWPLMVQWAQWLQPK